ncbi:MAG: hypothetical protein ACP5XB_26870, partial [Isosphaeraceae bacterium]
MRVTDQAPEGRPEVILILEDEAVHFAFLCLVIKTNRREELPEAAIKLPTLRAVFGSIAHRRVRCADR